MANFQIFNFWYRASGHFPQIFRSAARRCGKPNKWTTQWTKKPVSRRDFKIYFQILFAIHLKEIQCKTNSQNSLEVSHNTQKSEILEKIVSDLHLSLSAPDQLLFALATIINDWWCQDNDILCSNRILMMSVRKVCLDKFNYPRLRSSYLPSRLSLYVPSQGDCRNAVLSMKQRRTATWMSTEIFIFHFITSRRHALLVFLALGFLHLMESTSSSQIFVLFGRKWRRRER